MHPEERLIIRYIDKIWNNLEFDTLSEYVDPGFVDYSIPINALRNQRGTALYLKKLSESLSHHTQIRGLLKCDDLIICQFELSWYCVQGFGSIEGRRIFRVREGKILAHWEIISR